MDLLLLGHLVRWSVVDHVGLHLNVRRLHFFAQPVLVLAPATFIPVLDLHGVDRVAFRVSGMRWS